MQKLSLTGALALVVFATHAFAQPALESDEQKTLYALGVVLGSNIRSFDLSAAEVAIVAAGLNDAAQGNESRVDMDTYGPQIQGLADTRAAARSAGEKTASAQFVDSMSKEAGAERSPSGVIYIPINVGTGAAPTATDTVRVHYHGTLRDGSVFDSSVERGEPISFPLNGVISCWTEGVQKMKVGGKAKLVCPSDTAYGDLGQGPIPGGAALVFEIELLAIE